MVLVGSTVPKATADVAFCCTRVAVALRSSGPVKLAVAGIVKLAPASSTTLEPVPVTVQALEMVRPVPPT